MILRSNWPTNTYSCREAALFKAVTVKIWNPKAFEGWSPFEIRDRAALALSRSSLADRRLAPGFGAHAFYH